MLNDDDTLTVIEAARRQGAWAESIAMVATAHFADLRHTIEPAGSRREAWQEQASQVGGPGTPTVDEFAAAELAPVLRVSAATARSWIADCLDLRHRLPWIAAEVAAGRVDGYRARVVAQRTRELSPQQARVAQDKILPRLANLTGYRLRRAVDAEVFAVAPDQAEAERLSQRDSQRVFIDPMPGGVGELWARADNDSLLRIEERLNIVAGWLKELGDTTCKDQRRVAALALLADPEAVLDLWRRVQAHRRGEHAPAEAELPATTLYVHLRRDEDGSRRGELEGNGPITEQWARTMLGCSQVTLRPVLDLADLPVSTGYRPSETLREGTTLIADTSYFPYSDIPARRCDWDHLVPAPQGPTSADNGAPGARLHHRVKTHGRGWSVKQPFLGLYVWRSPTGRIYVVDRRGTTSLGRSP